eukprot:TRINITY_DN3889_c0_g1_i2.p1 TRINITY_DN3889_c0_g1~~TRINITY_DN3889_c0_g1_i2.p1  ORF type:complete len:378 (-),score=57.15 TRINITY_DN3889_c0_g1_i2:292-1425(-)
MALWIATTVMQALLSRGMHVDFHESTEGMLLLQHEVRTGRRVCKASHPPGLHLVQLAESQRQFLLGMPHEMVENPAGVPMVMAFHGHSDSPWYANAMTGLSNLTDRFGWIATLPFALNDLQSNGLGGVGACCPADCDDECCKQGLHLMKKDDYACGWLDSNFNKDLQMIEAVVQWTKENACVDTGTIFAIGFSSGGVMVNNLACTSTDIFRAVAPMSGDAARYPCTPARPISYVSMCGTKDDEAFCQLGQASTAKRFSQLYNCSGARPSGGPITTRLSLTTTCTLWDSCAGGNFVEYCQTEGLSHDASGHLRPDDTSYVRPGSDLDFPKYAMQKFSILAGQSILFLGHPTQEELAYKASQWPPPRHHDHLYIRHPSN